MSCIPAVLRENPQFLRQHNYLLLAHDLSLLVSGKEKGSERLCEGPQRPGRGQPLTSCYGKAGYLQHAGAAWDRAACHSHRSILPALASSAEETFQPLKEHAYHRLWGWGVRRCNSDEEGVAFLEVHPWHYCDDLSFLEGEAASVNKQQVPIRQLCVTSKWNPWLAPMCPCFPSCVCHPAWVIS